MLDLVQETVTHVRDSAESGETTAEGTSSPIKMN